MKINMEKCILYQTDVLLVMRYDVLAIVKSKVIPGSTIQFEFLIGYSQYAFIVIVEFAGGGVLNLSCGFGLSNAMEQDNSRVTGFPLESPYILLFMAGFSTFQYRADIGLICIYGFSSEICGAFIYADTLSHKPVTSVQETLSLL